MVELRSSVTLKHYKTENPVHNAFMVFIGPIYCGDVHAINGEYQFDQWRRFSEETRKIITKKIEELEVELILVGIDEEG